MPEFRYQEIGEVKNVVDQFVTKTLPIKDWTHSAHLTVGLWYVSKYGKQETSSQMPNLIRKYNESIGNVNDETSGYHETITQFWIWLLDCYWHQVQGKMSLLNACNHFLISPFGNPMSFLKFYSKQLIFSTEARQNYVEPDLYPLDSTMIGTPYVN